MIKKQYKFNPPVQQWVTIDPSAVFGVVIAVVVIDQGQFFVVHLAGPLDGLDEAARTGHGPIGGVIVSRRDRSLCVEDLRHILVEVHAVAVQGSALHEGQGGGWPPVPADPTTIFGTQSDILNIRNSIVVIYV